MKYCPITYQEIMSPASYSTSGLKLLSPRLHQLLPLNYSISELRQEALTRAGKMSIQGVQLKLSAQLSVTEQRFNIVDHFGHFILKPQSEYYPELPENEAISMSLAKTIGIEVPIHGLLYGKDGAMTYFIKRFDRLARNKKLAVEDFAQLSAASRETKYNSSMEKVSKIISEFCSYPILELIKLFKLTLFSFLIGNEDMHLKNFSLITRDNIIQLAPAYDLLNTSIVMSNPKEEIALPLHGKKNNLRQSDFLQYLANDILNLNNTVINNVISDIQMALPVWKSLIGVSYLSDAMKKKYLNQLAERCSRLALNFD